MSYFNPERRKRKSPLPLLILGSLCVFALYYAFSANQKTVPVLPENAVKQHLIRWLVDNPESWPAQDPIFNPAAVKRIYERTDYRLLWFDNYSLSDTANDLIKQLTAVSSGNHSSMVGYRYHLGYFDRTLRDSPQRLQMAAVLDVLLTDAFVSYAQDTQLDKLKPRSRPKRDVTPVSTLETGFRLASHRVGRQGSPNPSGRQYFRGYNRADTSGNSRYRRDSNIDRSQHYSGSNRSSYRALPRPSYRSNATARQNNTRFAPGGLPPRNGYQRYLRNEGGMPTVGRVPENSEGPYYPGNDPFGNDASALRYELDRYRQIAASGRWRPMPRGPAMTIGAKHPHVALLRDMLTLYGDYRGYYGYGGERDKFDRGLHEAVLRFQERHGLKADGIVGRETRKRLNLSPTARIRIIETNIRRREKLPAELGERFIQVNIPAYRLKYVENDRVRLSMKVVVGKPKHATPEINTRVSRVVFNPTWTVPRSILVKDILPKAKADPGGMQRMGYRVVNGSGDHLPLTPKNLSAARQGSYLMRQLGGGENILGRVKFEIPNSDEIYLHDTRARSLFSLTERGYSHGCIRLEKPRHLAEALLSPEGDWDQWRIDQLTVGDETTEVRLKENVKVYLTYWTAWVDGQGRLNFRPDIYGKDGLSANQF
ncbi:murein L,D-transpeptidase [Microbulbifer flavimaris]|uniref:Murein L,D-transpeptidase n=1 Tax=Microbulbifer flavimaris TaxID=1781068 RepID=A0ABX4I127_9GAMM|nr:MULTISPECIES: L,D-transpeptidase family protein [Microbulbifer]KUJ83664.1 peptidoglycan-binding protein [Microbulbifer sp. ZGT114]PCO05826.1 murein L,D-transpeptidase [Microbulbifer flavimaris]